jgi:tRNA threonylcarbamoyladenosine biosynthesis protein TsaB
LKLLAVDTSTEACSAALCIDGDIKQRYELAPREHSRLILGMIDDLLREADITAKDIDVLAFGRGPGSFMGVRIAAGVVQGISFAHSIPVVPVSTLAAISSIAIEQTGVDKVLAVIDARMKEVYWGVYTNECASDETSNLLLQGKEHVTAPELVVVPDSGQWVSAGSGWAAYADVFKDKVDDRFISSLDNCFPSAEVIARLAVRDYNNGISVPAAEAVPVYLRDDVARKSKA